jgi:single-strand DNA-binding protein
MKELIMAKCTITVKGNLGQDVETKFSKSGKPYSKLSVASTPSKKNEAGEWENGETMWFNVTVFAELNPFEFKKGQPVEVMGTFVGREFTKKDGTKGYSLDVTANDVIAIQKEKTPVKEFAQTVPAGWTPVLDDNTPF